ncbi:uncharacterized protein J3R85_017520 [Psidium guajava]|nr:uncharacterized protein J3R85_017520 [Psidium guajava]
MDEAEDGRYFEILSSTISIAELKTSSCEPFQSVPCQ